MSKIRRITTIRLMMSDEEVDLEILKRYQLQATLGRGAYGIVWKAREVASGAIVALKKVLGAFNNDVDAQRTYREVYLLQSMRHPNIVRLVNVHRAKNDYDLYLVFEYMHTDLYQLLNECTINDEQRTFIAFQIVTALIYLDSLGVVHRDLKPANILIDRDCIVKVADFGLARTVTPRKEDTSPVMTEYVATKLYRAPEVLLGSSEYGLPVDMWSLGCILAELFSYKPQVLFHSPPTSTIVDQLQRYFNIFGKPSEEDLCSVAVAQPLEVLKYLVPNEKLSLAAVLGRSDKELLSLIASCLIYNPSKRITPTKAIEHQFFVGSPMFSLVLQRMVVIKSETTLQTILRDDIRLSSSQYKKELYRLVLEKKAEVRHERIGRPVPAPQPNPAYKELLRSKGLSSSRDRV